MTKIEQVAAEIYASHFHCQATEWGKDGLPPSTRERFMRLARAAIEAMREPTDRMRATVSANWGRRTWAEYQEVIDAALSE